jgi:hypothetical protein
MSAKNEIFSASPQPTHIAYGERECADAAGKMTELFAVGTVETHRDGKGCIIQLDAFPKNGRIILRPIDDKFPLSS